MEKRRQELSLAESGYLQPLGRRKEPSNRPATTGIGEDLGSTGFVSSTPTVPAARPKLIPNPRARTKCDSPVLPSADSDTDPIDFLSSQDRTSTSGSTSSAQASSNSSSKRSQALRPPPFSKTKSSNASKTTSSRTTQLPKTTRDTKSLDKSDELNELSLGHKSRALALSRSSESVTPPDENAAPQTQPERRPAPAPFANVVRSRPVAENQNPPKQNSRAPKLAPPPFKKTASSLPTSKRIASLPWLDEPKDENIPLETAKSAGDPVPINKLPRIPKKGQSNSMASESPLPYVPKRAPAEFPMAAYARKVAAKTAAMEVDPPSPRKRFRDEDIEQLLQSTAGVDDSIHFGDDTLQHVDPEDLCPFCDELLPDNPSPDLLKTLADLKLVAKPEPRPRNPFGLTAPLTTFIDLCHMHRAERTYLQEGKANHWPVIINWNDVRERLSGTQIVDALREIVSDPQSSQFFVALSDNIKRQGVLKAASIKAQLDNFELAHPGYYGEQGTLVIFDVLLNLFPNLSPEECEPLQPREFLLSVLVPEAAALLVEQDMDCTHEEALQVLRESRQYGQMMFPDRGEHLRLGESDNHSTEEANTKQRQFRKDLIQIGPEPNHQPRSLRLLTGEVADHDVLVID